MAPGTASERTLSIVASKVNTARLSEDTLLPAMRALLKLDRVLAEPSGAAGVAARLSGQVRGTARWWW